MLGNKLIFLRTESNIQLSEFVWTLRSWVWVVRVRSVAITIDNVLTSAYTHFHFSRTLLLSWKKRWYLSYYWVDKVFNAWYHCKSLFQKKGHLKYKKVPFKLSPAWICIAQVAGVFALPLQILLRGLPRNHNNTKNSFL